MVKKYTIEKIDEKLKLVGFKRLNDYATDFDFKTNMDVICNCGNILKNKRLDKIYNGKLKCKSCYKPKEKIWTNDSFDDELIKRKIPLIRIDDIVGNDVITKFKYLDHHDLFYYTTVNKITNKHKFKDSSTLQRMYNPIIYWSKLLDDANLNIQYIKYENDRHYLKCKTCGYEWSVSRVDKIICNKPNCLGCLDRKVWTNELLDQELIKRNIPLKRIDNVINSKEKMKFQCLNDIEHIWETTITTVITEEGKCEHCSLMATNTPEIIERKLRRNNPTIKYIKEENNLQYFKCDVCSYEWGVKRTYQITQGNSGCPQCVNCAKITNEEIDKRLKEKNSSTIRLSNYNHYNDLMDWKCNICGHVWKCSTRKLLNRCLECPKCFKANVFKYEKFILRELELHFSENELLYHHRIKNIEIKDETCANIRKWVEIDFKIEYNNKIYFIEYNGPQHYKVHLFGNKTYEAATIDFKNQQIRDEWVRNYCKENNIILIEIDGRIYKNKNNTLKYLREIVDKIKKDEY